MVWLTVLVLVGVAAYVFGSRRARSASTQQSATVPLGSLWSGPTALGQPVGRYRDGQVWSGPNDSGTPVGHYDDVNIWSGPLKLGAPVANYANGQIWRDPNRLGLPVGRYGGGKVWVGQADLGLPAGHYDGEDQGAAAAAFLLLIFAPSKTLVMPV